MKQRMLAGPALVVLPLLLVLWAVPAGAAVISFAFTGVRADGTTGAVSGVFGYDLSALDTRGAGSEGRYLTGLLTASVVGGTQGGQSFGYSTSGAEAAGNLFVSVIDSSVTWGYDYLQLGQYFDPYPNWTGRIELISDKSTVFLSDSLPTVLSLADFPTKRVALGPYPNEIVYNITSLQPVPEPASILLMLSGCAGLRLVSRRRKK